jgi:activating signal cointegrator complex subunit 3
MNEMDIMKMLSLASEFEQLKVRDDELDELDDLTHENCEIQVTSNADRLPPKLC